MFYTCSWPRDGLQHFVQISSQDNLKSNPDPIHQSPRSNIFAQWEKGEREYFSLHFGTKSQRHWVKAQRCSTLDFSHKYRSYSLCTNAFNCARLRSEAEIGKYHCAGSTRRCWQGSRRKSGKNGVWRRQQLSSIIPGSLALFSSEASLYLVLPECALWTINGAKAAHTRIHPAVLFLHNVILYITKTYRVVVVLVTCDITRNGVSLFSINFRIQKLLSIQEHFWFVWLFRYSYCMMYYVCVVTRTP